jgi:hypothetical protein
MAKDHKAYNQDGNKDIEAMASLFYLTTSLLGIEKFLLLSQFDGFHQS